MSSHSAEAQLSKTINHLSGNVRARFGDAYPWFCLNDPHYATVVRTAGIGTALILIASFVRPDHGLSRIQDTLHELSSSDALLGNMTQSITMGLFLEEDLPVAIGAWVLGNLNITSQIRELNVISSRSIGELIITSLVSQCHDVAEQLRKTNVS